MRRRASVVLRAVTGSPTTARLLLPDDALAKCRTVLGERRVTPLDLRAPDLEDGRQHRVFGRSVILDHYDELQFFVRGCAGVGMLTQLGELARQRRSIQSARSHGSRAMRRRASRPWPMKGVY